MLRKVTFAVILSVSLIFSRTASAQKSPAANWPVSPNTFAQIIIVGIDSDTLYKIGPSNTKDGKIYKGSFPLEREWHAKLVRTLSDAGAKLIVFDMYFSPEWNSPGSKAFGNAVRKSATPVVVGFGEIPRTAPNAPVFDLARFELPRITPSTSNAPFAKALAFPFSEIINAGALMGGITDHPDPDGVLRNTDLFVRYENYVLPSIALATFLRATGASQADVQVGGAGGGRWMYVQGRRFQLTDTDAFPVALPPPYTNFKYVSFYDVVVPKDSYKPDANALHAQKMKQTFADRIAIVGFADSSLGDLKRTPAGNAYPGVEVLASTVNQLLNLYTGPRAAGTPAAKTPAPAKPSKPPKNTNIDIAVDELKHIKK